MMDSFPSSDICIPWSDKLQARSRSAQVYICASIEQASVSKTAVTIRPFDHEHALGMEAVSCHPGIVLGCRRAATAKSNLKPGRNGGVLSQEFGLSRRTPLSRREARAYLKRASRDDQEASLSGEEAGCLTNVGPMHFVCPVPLPTEVPQSGNLCTLSIYSRLSKMSRRAALPTVHAE